MIRFKKKTKKPKTKKKIVLQMNINYFVRF